MVIIIYNSPMNLQYIESLRMEQTFRTALENAAVEAMDLILGVDDPFVTYWQA